LDRNLSRRDWLRRQRWRPAKLEFHHERRLGRDGWQRLDGDRFYGGDEHGRLGHGHRLDLHEHWIDRQHQRFHREHERLHCQY
jgi:hypothetical protein